jgi:hypothetical protein
LSVALNTIYFKRQSGVHTRASDAGVSAKISGRGEQEEAPFGVNASARKTGADTSHHSHIGCPDNGKRARRVNSVRAPYPSVVRNETSHAISGYKAKREHRRHEFNELDHYASVVVCPRIVALQYDESVQRFAGNLCDLVGMKHFPALGQFLLGLLHQIPKAEQLLVGLSQALSFRLGDRSEGTSFTRTFHVCKLVRTDAAATPFDP